MREEFKEMTLKEKIDYIWDYYRIHIILVILILFVVGSIINIMFVNPNKKAYLNVVYLGTYIDQTDLDILGETLDALFIPADLKNKYKIEQVNIYDSDTPQLNMALWSKFSALSSMREIDILVTDQENFNMLLEQNALLQLDELIRKNNISDSRLIKQGAGIFGIRVAENSPLNDYNAELDILCVMNLSKRLNNIEEALLFLAGLD